MAAEGRFRTVKHSRRFRRTLPAPSARSSSRRACADRGQACGSLPSVSVKPLATRIGSAGRSARACAASCIPVIPGIMLSVNSRSNCSPPFKTASASAPDRHRVGHVVAEFLQHAGGAGQHQRIVVDQQDAQACCGAVTGRGGFVAAGLDALTVVRGSHSSTACRARLARQLQRAARLHRETVHHRQAEAGALAGPLGGEERIGRARQCRLIHAGAGVGDGQHDIVAAGATCSRKPMKLAVAAPPRGVAGGDAQPAAIRHGVARVGRQVEQRQFQLVRDRRTGSTDRRAAPPRGRSPGRAVASASAAATSAACGSSGTGLSSCWRAKASSRLVSAAPRSPLHRGIHQPRGRALRRRQALLRAVAGCRG